MSTGVLRLGGFLLAISMTFSAVMGHDKFSAALETWRNGDPAGALSALSELVDARSNDPRVYFYRGILATQLNRPSEDDFRKGARLEAATGNTRLVNTALEQIQGSLRAQIEHYRLEARADLKADPVGEKLKVVFRDAMELRRLGNLQQSLEKLNQLTSRGNDPRYFYLQGVVLSELNQTEQARAAFSEGLKRETTTQDVQRVNDMLSGVDGRVRLLVEEQTAIQAGDQMLSRSDIHREIRRRAMLTEDQLLAESNAAAAQAAEVAKSQVDARRQAAVAEIVANRELQAQREQKAAANAAAIAAKDQPTPSEPEVAVVTPEKPAMPEKKASSNPFLGGAVATPSAVSGRGSATGSMDLSWLPTGMEVLIYLRPAEMENSPLSKSMPQAQSASQAAVPGLQMLGLESTDVESVAIGVGNVVVSLLPLITQATAGAPPDPQQLTAQLMKSDAIAVVRLAKDIDVKALATGAGGTESTAGDKTFYVIQPPEAGQPAIAVHAVDARTVIAGTEASMKTALSEGPGEKVRENFSFIPGSSQFAVAFSTPLLAGMSGSIPDAPPTAPPQVAAILSAIKGKISGVAVIVDMTSDLDLTISLNLTEPEATTEANKAMTEGLALVQQMAPLLLGSAPQELQGGLQQMVASLSCSGRDTVLALRATVTGEMLKTIQQNPQLFAPQLQPGGPGFPGTPGQP
jgi:tetratricopeptide (TPR) repeat protein